MPDNINFMKIILDERTRPVIISRIKNLTPNAEGAWGKLTVNEMMFHCSKITNLILSAKQFGTKPTIKERFIKIIGLHIIKHFPKGVKTGSRYLKTADDNLDFEAERNNFIETINKAADYTENIYGNHPFFGPLNTKEWRRFLWMHTDHHLRQFNV